MLLTYLSKISIYLEHITKPIWFQIIVVTAYIENIAVPVILITGSMIIKQNFKGMNLDCKYSF